MRLRGVDQLMRKVERGITARYQNIHGGRFLDAYNTKDLMKVLICLGCDPKQVFIFYSMLLYWYFLSGI